MKSGRRIPGVAQYHQLLVCLCSLWQKTMMDARSIPKRATHFHQMAQGGLQIILMLCAKHKRPRRI